MQLERRRHRVRDAITGLPLYDYSARHECHCNYKGGHRGHQKGQRIAMHPLQSLPTKPNIQKLVLSNHKLIKI